MNQYEACVAFVSSATISDAQLRSLHEIIIDELKSRRRLALAAFRIGQIVEFNIVGRTGKKYRYNGTWRGRVTSLGQLNAKVLADKLDGTMLAIRWTIPATNLRVVVETNADAQVDKLRTGMRKFRES